MAKCPSKYEPKPGAATRAGGHHVDSEHELDPQHDRHLRE